MLFKTRKAPIRGKVAIAGTGAAMALVAFVGMWEGFSTTAYRDIVGVPTICYGETRGVDMGDSIPKEECDSMLMARLQEFESELDACLLHEEDIPASTKTALISWAYNVGTGAACKSTLVRLANAGNLKAACDQLLRWNRAGGKVVRGLTRRRTAERELCLRDLK